MENITPEAGALARREADGALELSVSSTVQAEALAAQAEAEVKARWAIAQRCPRQLDTVRLRLLKECERPLFAASARYAKPIGEKFLYGPSIRFVETALRCMGNVYAATTVVSEDQLQRRLQVVVTDLEGNVSWPRQISIRKTVERSKADDRTVVSKRTNKWGKPVFEVIATEDELTSKENAAVSKAIRTAGLRILPGDLVDEAMAKCLAIQAKADAADPSAARKKMVDAFSKVGVYPAQLEAYLGHSLEAIQPAELEELRGVYEALKDGESKWADVMELKSAEEKRPADFGTQAPPSPAKVEEKKEPAPKPMVGQMTTEEEAKPEPKSEPKVKVMKFEEPPPKEPDANEAAAIAIREAMDSAQSRAELNRCALKVTAMAESPTKKQLMDYFNERRKAVR